MEGALSRPGGLAAHLVLERGPQFRLDLGLSIQDGQTVALLGPNGAGKSTAVAALAGLLPVDRGHIVLGGRVLDDPEQAVFVPAEDRRIGVVFQDYILFPHLSVLENVAFGPRNQMARPNALRAASAWLERLGLKTFADRKPRDLSGGQAQRVALARALVTEPDMLLLDEPLSALDVTTRAELRRTLAEHLESFAGPRLLITHDPTEAFLLADEIHVVEEGSITQTGTADEIRLRPRTPYAADLAGSNLLLGNAAGGIANVDGHEIHLADTHVSGPVLLTVRPAAIAIYPRRPDGSPRNTWRTVVDLVETLGDRVRIRTGAPLPITAEITAEAHAELAIDEGSEIWVAIKATEVTIQPGAPPAGK